MHPTMCRDGLAGMEHADYTIGNTDKPISIVIEMGPEIAPTPRLACSYGSLGPKVKWPVRNV
jgi:hypothetical protein